MSSEQTPVDPVVNEPEGPAPAAAAAPQARSAWRRSRVRRMGIWVFNLLKHLPHLPLNTRRGVVLFAALVGGTAMAGLAGVTGAVHYSESTKFCGSCHSMDPEQKALASSAHSNVTCAECHVEPGVSGFLKAKLNGTRQLVHTITGNFPTPIEPPDHASLPSTEDTCMSCHSLSQITRDGGPTQLILRPTYEQNQANTKTTVAVLLRPVGLGANQSLGVHWHVEKKVDFIAEDPHSNTIDLVEFTGDNGKKETYIAGRAVKESLNADADIVALKKKYDVRTMDCLACHNRVGHPVPNTDRAVDEAMTMGKIDPAIAFVKRDVVAALNRDYPNQEAADKALDALKGTLGKEAITGAKAVPQAKIDQAVTEAKRLYSLIATPAMKVKAQTYADNLGHQNAPGCFRCHDGAHYAVVDGKVTNKTIPSTCGTCHTFPQAGLNVSNVAFGAKPDNHADKLWVFNHQKVAVSKSPTGNNCGTCHAPSYCAGCHDSGAIKVEHDTMLYNHAESVRISGGTASCAYCHQPQYCSQCHKSKVMEPNPLSHISLSGPQQ